MAGNPSVIVIGAGVAGLSAASKLGQAGLAVSMVEARDRLGGRVFTKRDAALDLPIELGAEFIHGLPPEIWLPLQKANIAVAEVQGENWCVTDQLRRCRFFSQIDKILGEMDDSRPDESFLSFLERCFPNPTNDPILTEAKRRALGYVVGFNAADPERVGVHWLVQGMRAEERIQGERAFRANNGYEALIEIFRRELLSSKVTVHTNTVVERVSWKKGKAEVSVSGGGSPLTADRVLITLPLAVLQAAPGERGAVEFVPSLPGQKLNALQKMQMGKVIRLVLRFRERFWDSVVPPADNKHTLSDMSFLFSQNSCFPTWWTTMPRKAPIITGWAPFHAGEELSGKDEKVVTQRGLQTLATLLSVDAGKLEELLETSYSYDWQSDPFSRGAYSYGMVGGDGAQQALAAPVENTVFFAGEATDITGNNGTVHGAIASGYRAAQVILEGLE